MIYLCYFIACIKSTLKVYFIVQLYVLVLKVYINIFYNIFNIKTSLVMAGLSRNVFINNAAYEARGVAKVIGTPR